MSIEGGLKYQGDIFGLFATAFYVETDDVNSESKGDDDRARVRSYESKGIEVEGVAQFGGLDFRGSLTWTDAEITGSNDPGLIGNTPRRQADWVWSLSPSYYIGEHAIGATVVGTTDSYSQDDNSYEMDGYIYVNLFTSIAVLPQVDLLVTANNVFNELGVTEAEGGFSTVNGLEFIRARSIAGRSLSVALTYTF